MNKSEELAQKIIIGQRLWKYAGFSLPVIFCGILFIVNIIGFETYLRQILSLGGIFFLTVTVLWWWWAVDVIGQFAKMNKQTLENFKEIKTELRKFREDLNK